MEIIPQQILWYLPLVLLVWASTEEESEESNDADEHEDPEAQD